MSLPSEEQWRPIPGWEGRYEASDLGRVRSMPRSGRRGVIRRPAMGKDGRLYVPLWRDNRCANFSVHRLVAMAFCTSRPSHKVVRHLDGNHLNNVASNLAWGTSSENNLDTVEHGRNVNAAKTHCIHGHEFTEANTIRKPGERGRWCRTCHYASSRQTKARARARQRAA